MKQQAIILIQNVNNVGIKCLQQVIFPHQYLVLLVTVIFIHIHFTIFIELVVRLT